MPDDSKKPQSVTSAGEKPLQSLLRLPRLIKVNPPNSPVALESFNNFKKSLAVPGRRSGQDALLYLDRSKLMSLRPGSGPNWRLPVVSRFRP